VKQTWSFVSDPPLRADPKMSSRTSQKLRPRGTAMATVWNQPWLEWRF